MVFPFTLKRTFPLSTLELFNLYLTFAVIVRLLPNIVVFACEEVRFTMLASVITALLPFFDSYLDLP